MDERFHVRRIVCTLKGNRQRNQILVVYVYCQHKFQPQISATVTLRSTYCQRKNLERMNIPLGGSQKGEWLQDQTIHLPHHTIFLVHSIKQIWLCVLFDVVNIHRLNRRNTAKFSYTCIQSSLWALNRLDSRLIYFTYANTLKQIISAGNRFVLLLWTWCCFN